MTFPLRVSALCSGTSLVVDGEHDTVQGMGIIHEGAWAIFVGFRATITVWAVQHDLIVQEGSCRCFFYCKLNERQMLLVNKVMNCIQFSSTGC